MSEERIDKILVQRKLVDSRVTAEKIIKNSGVHVNGKLISKSGKKFPIDCQIELIQTSSEDISTDAPKLNKALEHWNINVTSNVVLDLGAGNGGFTSILLKNKAIKVYALDSQQGILHASLLENNKVVNLENTFVRELNVNLITELMDGCTIDVSNLSLEKIFPFVHALLKKDAFVIAILRPALEMDKANLRHNGLVKDQKRFPQLVEKMKRMVSLNNLELTDYIQSPILGDDGNKELILLLKKI